MEKSFNYLFLIPARKSSKRIPGKNLKKLLGKPLIEYTIEYANLICSKNDLISISTDDEKILNQEKKYPNIRFINRPKSLCSDNTLMGEVLIHAINFFENKDINFKALILLQPTSPIRIKDDYKKLINTYNENLDQVVSVKISKENPYYFLYEINKDGYLEKSKKSSTKRSQDVPNVYCLNGSFFMYNIKSLKTKSIKNFNKIKHFVMPQNRSVDIDDNFDWKLAEYFLKRLENVE